MNATNETTTARAPQVWGTLQAHDAPALIAFYVDVFGFEPTAVYADGDQVAHAQLDWPEGGGIMLGSHKPDGAWTREPGTAGFYVVTDRVDEVHRRVVDAGAEVLREPRSTDYGSYEFACADREGNHWSFGTYRGESRTAG
ncbi:VOC family protein [Microlunatus ginsengisoli]|jgi:uncharacterized glyoxalase superfamily protein PhnB|uniref:VOC family protein n=1 Tax=Microlunatus ginsengisoli TaxID=363863 RepID=A0ABP7A7B5_9ACTN